MFAFYACTRFPDALLVLWTLVSCFTCGLLLCTRATCIQFHIRALCCAQRSPEPQQIIDMVKKTQYLRSNICVMEAAMSIPETETCTRGEEKSICGHGHFLHSPLFAFALRLSFLHPPLKFEVEIEVLIGIEAVRVEVVLNHVGVKAEDWWAEYLDGSGEASAFDRRLAAGLQ